MLDKPVYVTQPTLPPLEEFLPYLQEIWSNKTLTNGGPFHRKLESVLSEYLNVNHISLFANGTVALMAAIKALQLTGEVITTPYTFVATTHALSWSGLKPVFVDIDPISLGINPEKIEAAITAETSAILPVHCYGTPCDVAAIKDIADRHGLKVIYDAAHAFDVKDEYGSILRHGDLSILSFHATKVFSTLEGGAIICNDAEMYQHINRIRNFGFVDEITVNTIGINGKLNELSAAFGLTQLPHVPASIEKRQRIDHFYRDAIERIDGIRLFPVSGRWSSNYGYFPILIDESYPLTRDQLYQELKNSNIYARRYFYPLTSEFPMYSHLSSSRPDNLPVATRIASQIICLPIFADMSIEESSKVIDVLIHHCG